MPSARKRKGAGSSPGGRGSRSLSPSEKAKFLPKTPEAQARVAEGRRKARESYERNKRARAAGRPILGAADPTSSLAQWKRIDQADILEFATSDQFLGLELFPAQETILRALYGLPIPDRLLDLYRRLTTLSQVPAGVPSTRSPAAGAATEGIWVVGRRGTKSFLAAIVALYEATRPRWAGYLLPGESGYFIHIATREKQAQQVIGENCARMLARAGTTLQGIVRDWRSIKVDEIELANGMRIASFPSSSTAFLGLPCIGAVLDEVAFFLQDGPRSDEQIETNLRPAMAQFGGRAKFLLISNPGAKAGLLWDYYREGARVPGRLVIQAPTKLVNPQISDRVLESAKRRNPDAYARLYDAIFAERVEALFTAEMLDGACQLEGDLPVRGGLILIAAGLDASGLAGRDRMGFAIAGLDLEGTVWTFVTRTWDVTDPDPAFDEIGQLCRAYGVRECWIDRYAKGYVRALLAKQGVEAIVRPDLASVMLNLRTLALAGRLRMPARADLREGLERTQVYYSRANTPSIGRQRSEEGHGDLADGLASAVWGATLIDEIQDERVVEFDAVEHFGPICAGID